MTKFALIMLAKLISISTPGNSSLSRVPIEICDETCQQQPLCDNPHHWRCKKPKASQELYNHYYTKFINSGMTEQKAQTEANLRKFTRPESYEEGFVRNAIIAQAIDNVTEKTTRGKCLYSCQEIYKENISACTDNKCKELKEEEYKSCNNACVDSAPWVGGKEYLAHLMLIIINQESGQRADVHGGTGPLGRGDCAWRDSKGKWAPPFSKGASPIKNTCTSFGLGQRKLGNGKTKEGWTGEDLLGIDLKHTERSLTIMARDISRARNFCTGWGRKKVSDLPKAIFTAYGTGSTCTLYLKKDGKFGYRVKGNDDIVWAKVPPDNAVSKYPAEVGWPIKRSGIFVKYSRSTRQLTEKELELLQQPRIQKTLNHLLNTNEQHLWMIPINKSVDSAS